MKIIHSVIAALGFAFALPAVADAAANDPEVIIYRVPGVRDDGGTTSVGVATVFHCTSFSGDSNLIRFVTRGADGTLLSNQNGAIQHLQTVSFITHPAAAYSAFILNTGVVNSGTTAIAATSTNIICTAMTIDAANPKPTGVALRALRFSPVPGSQE
jgi:hypothetical protein